MQTKTNQNRNQTKLIHIDAKIHKKLKKYSINMNKSMQSITEAALKAFISTQ